MPTRNINLTEHLDRFVTAEVNSGRYGNASEVVREGLRQLEQRRLEEQAKLKWLRGAVRAGVEELDRGEGVAFGSDEELNLAVSKLAALPARKRRA